MGFMDWVGEQASRLGYQANRAGNAVQGVFGGGVQNYDPSQLNWAGVKAAPGETMLGDLGNTIQRTAGYAGTGFAVGGIPGAIAGGLAGLGQSAVDDPNAAWRAQQEQAPAPPTQPDQATVAAGQQAKATAQADTVQKNQADTLAKAAALHNPYTDPTNQGIINGLYNSAYNQPMIAGTNAAGDAVQAQNGGGAMGGYGGAAAGAIMAGAGVQARDAQAHLNANLLQEGANWDTAHINQLSQVNTSDPSFQNFQTGQNAATAQANNQRDFQQGVTNLQNQNVGAAAQGALGAIGGFASTPVGQGLARTGLGALGINLPNGNTPAAPAAANTVPPAGPGVRYDVPPSQGLAQTAMKPQQYGSFGRNSGGYA